jgi:hypothetical protein
MAIDLAKLRADDFEPQIASDFRFGTRAGELSLTLVEVRRLGKAVREGGAFSLTFLSASGPSLPQATYPVTHPVIGDFGLFVVPLGPKDGRNSYEAVFT